MVTRNGPRVGVAVGTGVAVGAGVAVAAGVGTGVMVAVLVGDGVGVAVGATVAVGEGWGVAVALGTAVGVLLGFCAVAVAVGATGGAGAVTRPMRKPRTSPTSNAWMTLAPVRPRPGGRRFLSSVPFP